MGNEGVEIHYAPPSGRPLGTNNYFRIRLGVGRPPGQQDPGDFVLKKFNSVEKKELELFLARADDAISSLVTKGLERTQQDFNS